jgi:SAM-dependent methyltransferase
MTIANSPRNDTVPLRQAWQFLFGFERRLRIRRFLTGHGNVNWTRVVMERETDRLVRQLPVSGFDVLEISGDKWKNFGFHTYRSVHYPDYDVCAGKLDGSFDLIVAEQVFEHLLWPYRAAQHVYEMLRPAGYFLVTTPFLLRVHEVPIDCSRWTETGMKYLLAEAGFPLDGVITGSWGNRGCASRYLRRKGFPGYRPWRDSLQNDPTFPMTVWALARK